MKEDIRLHLQCGPFAASHKRETFLCDAHYRSLHRELNPDSYQWKCVICSMGIKGSNYHKFRSCSEPEVFQLHLEQNTDFRGEITSNDKVCMGCYRFSLQVASQKPNSTDEDFDMLVDGLKASVPEIPYHASNEPEVLNVALTLTTISVAKELANNHALTLISAYSIFQGHVASISSSPDAKTVLIQLGHIAGCLVSFQAA